jgi:transposase
MERYVGIDVSKAALDVHVLPEGEALRVSRNAAGIDELVKWLCARQPRVIALEATGGFERVVAAELDAAGLPIVVVNPARVRDFASAVGRRAKTDAIDSAVIARFAEATKPVVRPLPDEQTRGLADLVARRRQIVEMLGAERVREQRAASRRLARSCQRLIKALERELADVDDEIDQAVQAQQTGAAAERSGGRTEDISSTDSRTTGTGNARSSRYCRALRPGAVDAAVGQVARQEFHRRRARQCALGPVHGGDGCGAAQPGLRRFL